MTELPLILTASLTCLSMRKYSFTLCKSCMKKFYFRTNHLSVESEELEERIYSWSLAGVLVFCGLKKLRVCFYAEQKFFNFHSFSGWMARCSELNKNLSTEPIYFLSLWWHSFTTPCCCPISVEVYRLDLLLIPHLVRSVVESSIATWVVYMKHR